MLGGGGDVTPLILLVGTDSAAAAEEAESVRTTGAVNFRAERSGLRGFDVFYFGVG